MISLLGSSIDAIRIVPNNCDKKVRYMYMHDTYMQDVEREREREREESLTCIPSTVKKKITITRR